MGRRPHYRVLSPIYDVTGGTAVEALEAELNGLAVDGYRVVAATRVRAEGEQAADVVILERVSESGD